MAAVLDVQSSTDLGVMNENTDEDFQHSLIGGGARRVRLHIDKV